MANYYDGSALLSKRDAGGKKPEIYMTVTNRSGGKTFFFSRLLLRRFMRTGEPFCVLIRWHDDLKMRAQSFAHDVIQKDPQLQGIKLSLEHMGKLTYCLHINDNPKRAVYFLALNDADKIRENSALFQDICALFLDEFQPETGGYVPDEVKKFRSVHTSIARGGESHVRYVPVYMCSNAVSKINPYFVSMGIHKKALGRQEYIRGNGWVLQQTVIDTAARELEQAGFSQAFEDNSYTRFAGRNEYLLDDSAFIQKKPISGRQLCALDCGGTSYGVWNLADGTIYISSKCDSSTRLHVAATRAAQGADVVSADFIFAARMRSMYDKSLVFFSDADSYAAFMSMYGSRTFT